MKYLGYMIILLGGVAGYFGVRAYLLLVLALLSTFAFAAARRQTLRDTPQAPDQNLLFDGAWLFFSQLLAIFGAYLIGVFCNTAGGELFGMWVSGNRG
jgi:hypothetical protein